MLRSSTAVSSTPTGAAPDLRALALVSALVLPLALAPASSSASIVLDKTTLYGGNSTTGSVSVASAASAPLRLSIASDKPEVTVSPAVVIIPAGQTTAAFQVKTTGVSVARPVVLTAMGNGTTSGGFGTASLQLLPAVISRIEFAPAGVSMGQTTMGTVHLDGAAPPGGINVYLSLDPKAPLDLSSRTVHVDPGKSSGTFSVTPHRFSVPISASGMMGNPGGATRSLFIGPIGVASIELPDTVIGGWSGDATVLLDRPAGAGGYVAPLQIDQPTQPFRPVGELPASITYPAGALSRTVHLETSPVPVSVTVKVALGPETSRVIRSLVIRPVGIENLVVQPTRISKDHPATLTVSLETKAPAGGATVALSQAAELGSPLTFDPPTVTFPEGAQTMTVRISCGLNLFKREVRVIAKLNGITKTTVVTVGP